MFRDIVVHVDKLAENKDRIALACALARDHEANLTGVAFVRRQAVPAYARAQIGDKTFAAVAETAHIDAEGASRAFIEQCKAAGIAVDCHIDESDIVDGLALHARHADLTVIGQNIGADMGESSVADRLILIAARPVLVVPSAGTFDKIGETVMVAWDAGCPATRAVNDAMPILKKAKKVYVVAADSLRRVQDRDSGDAVGRHLSRHGIDTEVSTLARAGDIDVGNALLSRAADFGVDMIVMGAYGHSRLRELVLGGVTRLMLREMTIPVLMSH